MTLTNNILLSKNFVGAKPGYYFGNIFVKGKAQGVGYYLDNPPKKSIKSVKKTRFLDQEMKGDLYTY